MKKYIYGLFIVGLLLLQFLFVWGNNYTVSIRLNGQGLIIGTPGNLNLGTVSEGHTITGSFSSPFWIEDLRGISQGHYTTIQCDGLYQDGGDGVITGVQLSRGTGYFLIAGRTNGTTMNPELSGYTDITTPKLFFYRNDSENNGGVLNRYGVLPYIKVSVPAGTPSGTYKGKITYTLYDMSFTRSGD